MLTAHKRNFLHFLLQTNFYRSKLNRSRLHRENAQISKHETHDVFEKSFIACMSFRYSPHTHQGRLTHIHAHVNEATIDLDNGSAPPQHQAIIWTNTILLSVRPLGSNFRNTTDFIHLNWLENMVWNMVSILFRPYCVEYVQLDNARDELASAQCWYPDVIFTCDR